jgi:putative phage-type endonuclease
MSHSPEWHAARRLGIGGSDANTIMGGEEEKIIRLWREKRGEIEPEDLSWVLPVQMGLATEELNERWFTHHTGLKVVCQQEMVVSNDHPWMRVTLDGVVEPPDFSASVLLSECPVWEAKHLSQFTKKDEPPVKYYPQLQHQMAVTGASKAYLSVIFGTFDYQYYEIEADPLYQAQLIAAERAFWACVETGDPPCVINVPAPVEAIRKADMSASNAWAEHADKWLKTRAYSQTFDKATKELKALVDADVVEASGHGVTARRNKAGSISLSESK